MLTTQERQKVHSKVQIIASVELGGSAALQFSQVGLSSSTAVFFSFGPGRGQVPRPGGVRWVGSQVSAG